ncbi:MAG: hypothetical protein ABSH56_20205 [Bryobacteraceae bacterium]
MQRPGRNLFAGAGLAGDQNCRPARCNQADDLDYLLNLGAVPYQALPPPFSAEGFTAELERIINMLIIKKISIGAGAPAAFQTIWSGRHHSSESAGCRKTLYDSSQDLLSMR